MLLCACIRSLHTTTHTTAEPTVAWVSQAQGDTDGQLYSNAPHQMSWYLLRVRLLCSGFTHS